MGSLTVPSDPPTAPSWARVTWPPWTTHFDSPILLWLYSDSEVKWRAEEQDRNVYSADTRPARLHVATLPFSPVGQRPVTPQPLLVLVNPAHPCSVPASGSDGFPRGSRFGCFIIPYYFPRELPRWLSCKDSTCRAGDAGDVGLIPGSGRFPGRGNSNLLWYSCLENPMDRGAWQSIVHEVTESWMWLSNWTTPFSLLIAFCQDSEWHRMWEKKNQRWHPSYWSEQLKRGLLFAELKQKLTM